MYPGADVHGELRLIAHKRQSYDIHLRLSVPSLAAGVPDHVVCHLPLLWYLGNHLVIYTVFAELVDWVQCRFH